MNIELLSIDTLKPYPHNPRKNEHAVSKIAASLKEFGWQQPIVVDEDHVIIVGHTRWLAAKHLQMSRVPVLIARDLTPAQVKAYRLADNRLQDEAQWDVEALRLELKELNSLSIDLALTGFDQKELDELSELSQALAAGVAQLHDEETCPPLPQAPVTKPGDVWVLGEHRLLCGDSIRLDEVERLMQGEKADLVFTDPFRLSHVREN